MFSMIMNRWYVYKYFQAWTNIDAVHSGIILMEPKQVVGSLVVQENNIIWRSKFSANVKNNVDKFLVFFAKSLFVW